MLMPEAKDKIASLFIPYAEIYWTDRQISLQHLYWDSVFFHT